MSVLAKMTGGTSPVGPTAAAALSASSTSPTEPPTRRTPGRTPGPSAHESPQERDRRDLAAVMAEFTPAMRIAFHAACGERRKAGENPAGLEWRAVVDVRRRFDPAGWIVSVAAAGH